MSAPRRIPAYYINLASRPDRRTFMEEQFERLGMSVTRIEATTSAEVPPDRAAARPGPHRHGIMSKVEIACMMSHEQAWRRFLATDADHALILEDDVVLSAGMPHFLDANLHVELGVDVMKLETFRQNIRLGRARRLVGERWEVRQLLSSHLGTAAYVISRRRAQSTLADPRAYTMPPDCYLFDKRGPVLPAPGIFQVEPALALQLQFHHGDARSDVTRSDLAVGRGEAERQAPDTRDWQKSIAKLKYKIRTIVQTYQDAEAIRTKRRFVPFDGDIQ